MSHSSRARTPLPSDPRDRSPYHGWTGHAIAVAMVGAASLVAWALSRVLSGPNLVFYAFAVHVFAVALLATRLTPVASVVAAVLAALSFDVFFMPARSTLGTSATEYLVAFGIMLVLAILISESAARIRAQTAALRARQRELEILIDLDRALAEADHPADVARIAAARSLSLLGVDGAAALLLDEPAATLRLLHAESLPPSVAAILERGIPVGTGVAGRAVAERRPVITSVAQEVDPAGAGLAAALRASGHAMVAATPFMAHGAVHGALSLASRRPLEVTPAMLSLLASIGTCVGVAIAHAVERQRLADQQRMAALGRLAAGVAHELNNPLSAIANYVGLCEGEVAEAGPAVGARLARHLATVDEAVERMRRIVSGLSTYSKPRKPEPQPLNVAELLEATHQLVAFTAARAGAKITVDVPPALPAVLGDRSALMQVLLNLANNALEAMAEPGGRLTLTAWAESNRPAPTPVVVKIAVRDTGPGIEPENLRKIWSAFYTSKAEGTGLGLAIVRGIVNEIPGARIDVESEPGRGTTFTLTLPAAPAGGD